EVREGRSAPHLADAAAATRRCRAGLRLRFRASLAGRPVPVDHGGAGRFFFWKPNRPSRGNPGRSEPMSSSEPSPDWRDRGVRIVRGSDLDPNTPQTPGMSRAAAINFARAGAQKLWAGTVTIHPDAKTGAHHHGPLESVIYVVKGRARMRWGEKLEFTAEAGPGDFIYVPPYVPHQEINASATEVLECVLCRSDGQAVAVNLDIEPVEKPEQVLWVDPTHPHGGV